MKLIIMTALIGLAFSLSLNAEPSSNVAFDLETRNLIKSGDANAGVEKIKKCVRCHGAEGVASLPRNPSLAGQLAAYTFKQLKDYKDQKRGRGVPGGMQMISLLRSLSDQDMADIAAFYASKPLPVLEKQPEITEVPVLVKRGDGKRMIAPCASCHGSDGKGRSVNVAALAGQHVMAFKNTMQHYANGKRSNDVYSPMRNIASKLTPEEIDELAAYYAGMK